MTKKMRPEAVKNLKKLPKECWSTLAIDGSLTKIKAGESGYYPIDKNAAEEALRAFECSTYDELADKLNKQSSVTKQQRQAMTWGSQFGWHVQAADPDFWNGKVD